MVGAGLSLAAAAPQIRLLAQQARDFIEGPPVPDIEPTRLSERVWMVFSPDGFPTPQNQGMMSNVSFVITSQGVVFSTRAVHCKSGRWSSA